MEAWIFKAVVFRDGVIRIFCEFLRHFEVFHIEFAEIVNVVSFVFLDGKFEIVDEVAFAEVSDLIHQGIPDED